MRKFLLPAVVVLLVVAAMAVFLALAVAGLRYWRAANQQEAVILTFEVDRESLPGEQVVNMNALIRAVDQRLNPGWSKQAHVRQVGEERIEVATFTADPREIERIEYRVQSQGTIEFRILANQRDHKALVERALEADAGELYQLDQNGDRVLDQNGRPTVQASWVRVAKGEEEGLLSSAARAETVRRKTPSADYEWTEFLVVNDVFNVNGNFLIHARPGIDPSGRPSVLFTFNRTGGKLFGGLTGKNMPDEASGFSRHLGIILDSYLQSAPAIRSTIFDRGEITGSFTRQEVQDMVDILNAGSLPAPLKKAGERPAGEE